MSKKTPSLIERLQAYASSEFVRDLTGNEIHSTFKEAADELTALREQLRAAEAELEYANGNRCWICKQPINDRNQTGAINVAPSAANGGTWRPTHNSCLPSPFSAAIGKVKP